MLITSYMIHEFSVKKSNDKLKIVQIKLDHTDEICIGIVKYDTKYQFIYSISRFEKFENGNYLYLDERSSNWSSVMDSISLYGTVTEHEELGLEIDINELYYFIKNLMSELI